MAKTTNHTELLKAAKKAVNSLMFNPTPSKKVAAIDALASICQLVLELDPPKEDPKPKASKSKKKPKASKAKSKSKTSKKAVRRPKRSSADGLEQAQAKAGTANKVGKVAKTKVVHAITEGDAQPFEPRKEVPVVEPKVRKKEQMKLTLLPGESVDEAMARHRSAVLEQERLEAEALIADSNPMMEPSFAPAV